MRMANRLLGLNTQYKWCMQTHDAVSNLLRKKYFSPLHRVMHAMPHGTQQSSSVIQKKAKNFRSYPDGKWVISAW